ncbi:hypothetical protein N7532_001484 [Penicillium argentinense]|uniref:Uncharacterized protein n=1 Tax=Penicillium argentinense TaxID=1131581 RepID=A0A9W9G2J5_9EURO|nr:uncharacterized protein N7532_001484 [Penicillium argentinense]KAJ5110949.1 hypothetical protein N7532_001484 [Penicillium argentinense]
MGIQHSSRALQKKLLTKMTAIKSEPISDLITIDNQYLDRVTARRTIISKYDKTVHGCLKGGESAVYELYSFLLTHFLPSRFPDLFTLTEKAFHNKVTGKSFPTSPPQDPELCLRILAETIEEDIFLLKETKTTHICLAFACCFPTGFDPSAKLGLDLKGIHGPVPGYEKIGPNIKAEGTGPDLADAIEGLQKGNAPGMFKYKSAIRWGKSVAGYLRS